MTTCAHRYFDRWHSLCTAARQTGIRCLPRTGPKTSRIRSLSNFSRALPRRPRVMNLTNLPTAICHVPSPEHDLADHPENSARFAGFEDLLQRFPTSHLHRITAELANDASLHSVHPPTYLAALQQAAQQGPAIIDFAPTYVTPSSYDDALLAAGAVVQVATKVWGARPALALP